jgi:hypothetical protein
MAKQQTIIGMIISVIIVIISWIYNSIISLFKQQDPTYADEVPDETTKPSQRIRVKRNRRKVIIKNNMGDDEEICDEHKLEDKLKEQEVVQYKMQTSPKRFIITVDTKSISNMSDSDRISVQMENLNIFTDGGRKMIVCNGQDVKGNNIKIVRFTLHDNKKTFSNDNWISLNGFISTNEKDIIAAAKISSADRPHLFTETSHNGTVKGVSVKVISKRHIILRAGTFAYVIVCQTSCYDDISRIGTVIYNEQSLYLVTHQKRVETNSIIILIGMALTKDAPAYSVVWEE